MQIEDLTGKRFGRLTVARIAHDSAKHTKWVCQCDCGNVVTVQAGNLKSGHTTSCGCAKRGTKPPLHDLVGKRFGKLVVICEAERKPNTPRMWLCRCDCGNTTTVRGSHLTDGSTKSCGCVNSELLIERNTTHGDSHSRLYGVYRSMLQRCYNPNTAKYRIYGALGVTVCDEWKESYESFKEWAYSNGYRDDSPLRSHKITIDRINPFGNYEPSNCRWVDAKVQYHNQRKDWKGDK